MNSLEATAYVIEALEKLGIDYLLVGAFSSNAYGIARSTKDADFVAALKKGDLHKLVKQLGEEFKLDPQMRFETITNSVRNVITYLPTGLCWAFALTKSIGITSSIGRPFMAPAIC